MVKRMTVGTERQQIVRFVGAVLRNIVEVMNLQRQDATAYWVRALVPRLMEHEPLRCDGYGGSRWHMWVVDA